MTIFPCYYCERELPPNTHQCPHCSQSLLLDERYQLVRMLGQGGFGVVYEAMDTRMRRRCAIKRVVAASLADQQLIEAEATMFSEHAGRLPFVAQIYDFWSRDGQTYLVMEYIEGKSLDTVTPRPWLAQRVLWFLRTMLSSLVQLHALGIIHRDIKPTNILLTPENRLVLLDFGIAKQGGVTMTAARAASLEYAPPEQLQRQPTDARSDLYSLGATAYELFKGEPPTPAYARLAGNNAIRVYSEPGTPDHAVEVFLLSLLALEPNSRPQSAQEALQQLDQLLAAPPGRFDVVATSAGQPTISLRPSAASVFPAPGGVPLQPSDSRANSVISPVPPAPAPRPATSPFMALPPSLPTYPPSRPPNLLWQRARELLAFFAGLITSGIGVLFGLGCGATVQRAREYPNALAGMIFLCALLGAAIGSRHAYRAHQSIWRVATRALLGAFGSGFLAFALGIWLVRSESSLAIVVAMVISGGGTFLGLKKS